MIHRLLPGPVLFLTVLALLTFWLDQAIRQPRFREDNGLNNQPDYIIENLSGVQVDHDKAVRYLFSAETMIHFPMGDRTHLEQIGFVSVQPNEPSIQLSADRAELFDGSHDIYLSGNVFILREKEVDEDKVTMATQFLHLIPDSEIAKTDQPVTVTRRNTTLNAVGMELNHRTGQIQLKSRVRASDDKMRAQLVPLTRNNEFNYMTK